MTEEALQAIEWRARNATPEPWEWKGESASVWAHASFRFEICNARRMEGCHPVDYPNLDFIAHAREDVPALCAEIRRLTAENRRLAGDLIAMRAFVLETEADGGDEH